MFATLMVAAFGVLRKNRTPEDYLPDADIWSDPRFEGLSNTFKTALYISEVMQRQDGPQVVAALRTTNSGLNRVLMLMGEFGMTHEQAMTVLRLYEANTLRPAGE